MKEGSTGEVIEGSMEEVKEGSMGEVKEGFTGVVKEGSAGIVKEGSTGVVKEGSMVVVMDGSTDVVKEGSMGVVMEGSVIVSTTWESSEGVVACCINVGGLKTSVMISVLINGSGFCNISTATVWSPKPVGKGRLRARTASTCDGATKGSFLLTGSFLGVLMMVLTGTKKFKKGTAKGNCRTNLARNMTSSRDLFTP